MRLQKKRGKSPLCPGGKYDEANEGELKLKAAG